MTIEEITSLLQSQLASTIQSDALPNGVNAHDVANVASQSVVSTLGQQINAGDFGSISEMFSGRETAPDHSSIEGFQSTLTDGLRDKLGLDSSAINGIISQIGPAVMNAFNGKASSEGFDIHQIISQFQGGGIGNMIQDFIGDSTSGSGGSKSPVSGILSLIKGIFGRK